MPTTNYSVPGIDREAVPEVIEILDRRLASLIDLTLTLKHVHWNVVGPNFISVHEMLDPQADAMRSMVDETAERIAALGGTPVGTPGALVMRRTWDDYQLGRGLALEHLAALDHVYAGVIVDHREAQQRLAALDAVSEDMVIGHLHQLEQFRWFITAHLEASAGEVMATNRETEEPLLVR